MFTGFSSRVAASASETQTSTGVSSSNGSYRLNRRKKIVGIELHPSLEKKYKERKNQLRMLKDDILEDPDKWREFQLVLRAGGCGMTNGSVKESLFPALDYISGRTSFFEDDLSRASMACSLQSFQVAEEPEQSESTYDESSLTEFSP